MMPSSPSPAARNALFERLLAAHRWRMDSPAAWAAWLGRDFPLAATFLDRLAAEWPDAPPPDAFSAALAARVRGHLSAWHSDWAHLWAHIRRVTGLALVLGAEAGIDPVPVYLAGLCHDVAKLDEAWTGQPHEVSGADFAGRALRGHLSPPQIAAIQAAIRRESASLLALALDDADKLDKIGAAGVVRRVGAAGHRANLDAALHQIRTDAVDFPPMHFARSRALAAEKRAFLAWLWAV